MPQRSQAEQLREYFDRKLIKRVRNMDYIPVSEVIARLNRVLGPQNWDETIVNHWRDGDWVMAHVRVTATIDGERSAKDGFGGHKVEFLKGKDDPVDLGNTYKGAASDAFKKACQQFGIALELARTDEALDYEEALDEDAADYVGEDETPVPSPRAVAEPQYDDDEPDFGQNAAPAPAPEPVKRDAELVTDDTWARFSEFMDEIDSKTKQQVQAFWVRTYPNAPAPRFSTATEAQIKDVLIEIVRLQMGAEKAA